MIAQALEITKLQQRVKKLERRNKLKVSNAIITTTEAQVPVATTATLTTTPTRVVAAPSRRRKGVVIRDPKEESTTSIMIPAETKSKDKDKAAKKQKLDEEVEELKRHLQIVSNNEDDVYTEATPLARKDDEIEPAELQEVVEVVTTAKLMTKVVTAASATITAAVPILTTAATPTLTTAPSASRRRKEVVIRDLEETATPSTIIHSKAKSKDKGKGILVEE
nr:hypothetical protein [Tanacetum cinerariifolium]